MTDVLGSLFELRRDSSDLWRIFTCHFAHWSYEQLAWDAAAFLALGAPLWRRHRAALHATLLASAIVIPIAVLTFAPEVIAYRGLSGLASALFALLLVSEWRRMTWPVALCAIGFIAKLAFESTTGATVFVSNMGPGVAPVPVAHLAGALVGVVAGLGKRAAVLAPLLLASCVSLPLPLPKLDQRTCDAVAGRWKSHRVTQLGPANVDLVLGDDCRFRMRIQLPLMNVDEEGSYRTEGNTIRFSRKNGETVWPYERRGNQLILQESANERHSYTLKACESFWPCSSRSRR